MDQKTDDKVIWIWNPVIVKSESEVKEISL